MADHEQGLHHRTLTYWRSRLAAMDAPNRIFQAAVRQVVAGSVSEIPGDRARRNSPGLLIEFPH